MHYRRRENKFDTLFCYCNIAMYQSHLVVPTITTHVMIVEEAMAIVEEDTKTGVGHTKSVVDLVSRVRSVRRTPCRMLVRGR